MTNPIGNEDFRRSRSIVGLAFVPAFALALSVSPSAQSQEEPANVTSMKTQDDRRLVFEPYIGGVLGDYTVEQPSTPNFEARWLGFQFGVRMFTDATRDRKLLIGFDLRQRYGWTDGFAYPLQNPDLRETSLGVRADWHPGWSLQPVFGIGWTFGDVWRLKTVEKSFTGNAITLSASVKLGFGRVYVDGEYGKFAEGSGFIYTGTLGEADMSNFAVIAGVVYPLEVPSPDWLAIGMQPTQ